MENLATELQNALEAVQAAQNTVATQEPTLGDKVLAAVLPVLLEAGYTAPAVQVPVTELDPTTEQ